MEQVLSREEQELCKLLFDALHGKEYSNTPMGIDWMKLIQMADRHKVLPLLYDLLQEIDISEIQKKSMEQMTRQIVQQTYRLLFLGKSIIEELKEHGIDAILLKGCGVAALYPVPEYRKSGDIDLLLQNQQEVINACKILEKHGFKKEDKQHANYHVACTGPDGIELELHMALAEDFDNEKANQYLKKCQSAFFEHRINADVMGVEFSLATKPYQAFYLLLHMLHHFLRSGFGLKLLCDWVVFWEQPVADEEKELFINMCNQIGITGFAYLVTRLCTDFLGLDKNKVFFIVRKEQMKKETIFMFMKEIFEAEEFGHSDSNRMVVLRGIKLKDYMREFHHQMKLTYPKACRCIVLYPVLWMMTLYGFLYRNRKIRGTSSGAILKKTYKRSKLMDQMHLFQ